MTNRFALAFVAAALSLPLSPSQGLAQSERADAQALPRGTATCGAATSSRAAKAVRYINPETMFEASSYSKAAVVPPGSELVVISGVIPVNKLYAVQGNDLKSQVLAALENLCQVMRAAGVGKNDIVRLGISYVHRDASDPFVISEMMSAFWSRDSMPTTTMTGVSFLIADNIRFQIEATAVVDKN